MVSGLLTVTKGKGVDRALSHPSSLILPPFHRGAVAQLGERLNGIQEVVGSIPIGSTIRLAGKRPARSWWFDLAHHPEPVEGQAIRYYRIDLLFESNGAPSKRPEGAVEGRFSSSGITNQSTFLSSD